MRFDSSLRGSKIIRYYNNVGELPTLVQMKKGCKVWSECGFVGIDFDHVGSEYSQVMPCDREAIDWIKVNFKIN